MRVEFQRVEGLGGGEGGEGCREVWRARNDAEKATGRTEREEFQRVEGLGGGEEGSECMERRSNNSSLGGEEEPEQAPAAAEAAAALLGLEPETRSVELPSGETTGAALRPPFLKGCHVHWLILCFSTSPSFTFLTISLRDIPLTPSTYIVRDRRRAEAEWAAAAGDGRSSDQALPSSALAAPPAAFEPGR